MSHHLLTAHEIRRKVSAGELSSQDIYQSQLHHIQQVDDKVKAYVRLNTGILDAGPMDGQYPAPIAIKDNMCLKGFETTCASKILAGFKPTYNATVIEKIRSAGIPITGHVNMDEFAFGSSTENSCYGPTKNPWDLDCVPGGSSGGSTAAVGAHEAIWALGSDTGGSIRQPAAFCGVVGVKPTYGRVSRYGLIAFASSLDQIGPITKDVEDAAILTGIIAGHDPMDSTSADVPVPDYTEVLGKGVKGVKIGIPQEYFIDGIQPEIKTSMEEAIKVLKDLGAEFIDISLPHTEYSTATYYIVATAEASSNLARFDGVRYGLRKTPATQRQNPLIDMFEETRSQGFGAEAKRRIMLGTYSLSSGYYDAYYLKGQKVRTLIRNDFDQAFTEVDAIIAPTSPSPAFKIGERSSDPLSMYLSDIFTISANLAGIPAMSIPCGFSKKGLPIGMQIMTKSFAEETMFQVAHAYEQATPWHKEIAPIAKNGLSS